MNQHYIRDDEEDLGTHEVDDLAEPARFFRAVGFALLCAAIAGLLVVGVVLGAKWLVSLV